MYNCVSRKLSRRNSDLIFVVEIKQNDSFTLIFPSNTIILFVFSPHIKDIQHFRGGAGIKTGAET